MISYIGLGSNLDKPLLQLKAALKKLQDDTQINVLKVSGFYQSKALILPGTSPQNDYINAVAMLDTTLSAMQLLLRLNEIEASQGRERNEKWSARTLDLDILLYDEQIVQTDKLMIPHTQMEFRNFVIHPLFEIAGAITIPGLGDLAHLAKEMDWEGLQRISNKDVVD